MRHQYLDLRRKQKQRTKSEERIQHTKAALTGKARSSQGWQSSHPPTPSQNWEAFPSSLKWYTLILLGTDGQRRLRSHHKALYVKHSFALDVQFLQMLKEAVIMTCWVLGS